MTDLLIAVLGSEYMKTLLSPEMLAEFTKFSAILAMAWASFGRKITKHFDGMRTTVSDELKGLRSEIHDFKEVVRADLLKNSNEIFEIKQRVDRLEITKRG